MNPSFAEKKRMDRNRTVVEGEVAEVKRSMTDKLKSCSGDQRKEVGKSETGSQWQRPSDGWRGIWNKYKHLCVI